MFSESQERDMIVGKELANALEKNTTGKEDTPGRRAVRIPKRASRGRVHTGDTEAAHLSTDTKPRGDRKARGERQNTSSGDLLSQTRHHLPIMPQ